MKKGFYTKKLISSIFATIALLYFVAITPSPKIIFVPFLICSISIAAQNALLLLDKQKPAMIFHKLFIVGFLLFWFGLLVVALYICIRDKNYRILLFTLPFWVVGISLIKNKFLKKNSKKESKFNFALFVSAGLVMITLLAGIVILILGIRSSDAGLMFAGAFFAFGAFTFVLVALMAHGCFDKVKFDVFGIYVGILFVAIGSGFIALQYGKVHSLARTIQSFGLWILIPILLIAVGVFQIVKCLYEK